MANGSTFLDGQSFGEQALYKCVTDLDEQKTISQTRFDLRVGCDRNGGKSVVLFGRGQSYGTALVVLLPRYSAC